MKLFGSLFVLLGLFIGVSGFVGTFMPTQTAMQQAVSAIILVSGIASFLGGAILFSLGDVCRLLKEIKKELLQEQKKDEIEIEIKSKCSVCGTFLNILDQREIKTGKCINCLNK